MLSQNAMLSEVQIERWRIPPDLIEFFEPALCCECYVCRMVAVFREVHRVLRDDGTVWLNLGDSYSGSGKGGNPDEGKQATSKGSQSIGVLYGKTGETAREAALTNVSRRWTTEGGIAPKNLIGVPWRMALALQADGWILRQDIIWAKPNPMPESVRDRCTKAHEYIFLLAKSQKYYFDSDAIKEPSVTNDTRRPYGSPGANELDSRGRQGNGEQRDSWKGSSFGKGKTAEHQLNRSQSDETRAEHNPLTRNKRSVWTVTTKPFKGAHFATFPPDLITPCILAGCPPNGFVLDPFAGSGTTGLVAQRHGRQAMLLELNPAYVGMAVARIKTECKP